MSELKFFYERTAEGQKVKQLIQVALAWYEILDSLFTGEKKEKKAKEWGKGENQ